MVFANVFPVAIISLGGLESEATVWQAVVALGNGPGVPVAIAAGMIAIGVPALQVVTLLWILSFAVAGRSCPYFVPAMRVLQASKPWGMIEVCLLAILVAVVKLSGFLHVVVGIGIAAIVVLAPLMAVITNRSAGDLWPLYEARNGLRFQAARAAWPDHLVACDLCGMVHEGAAAHGSAAVIACARCGSEVRARKPDSVVRTWALLLAALVFYIPANVLPVMYTRLLGSEAESTILEGVVEFWRSGSWDIAVLIFTASVAVPCTKFLAIGLVVVGSEVSDRIPCREDPVAEAGGAHRLLVDVGCPGRGAGHRADPVPGPRCRGAAAGNRIFRRGGGSHYAGGNEFRLAARLETAGAAWLTIQRKPRSCPPSPRSCGGGDFRWCG